MNAGPGTTGTKVRADTRSRFSGSAVNTLVFAAVAGITVALNVVLSNVNVRIDLTEEKLYELSDGTRSVLRGLQAPVVLKFFFNGSSSYVPVPWKGFARRVEDLLVEYRIAGAGKVIVEKYDPEPDSDAEEWAQRYGIIGRPLGLMGPPMYFGLVAVVADSEEVIPVLQPGAENLLEYNITQLIARAANPKKPVIAVISSLPVLGTPRSPYPMQQGGQAPAWFVFRELQRDYDISPLEMPDTNGIPAEVDVVVLVHPRDLTDEMLYALDQFVLCGGRLVAFVDPLCLTQGETQMMPQMFFAPKASTLGRLFDAWGVGYEENKVVADFDAVSTLRTPDGKLEKSLVWLSLFQQRFNAGDALTSQLEFMVMLCSGSFSVKESKDVQVTPLITSSEESALIDATTAELGGEGVRRGFSRGQKKLNLALRLHGRFKTAFPEGKPRVEEDKEKKDEKKAAAEAPIKGLTESVKPATIVLVADVDMLNDRHCVEETVNMFGVREPTFRNDNFVFVANVIEQLSGSAAMVGIRTRGKTERPFEKVRERRRVAEERYIAEELRLETELNQARQRLSEMPGATVDEKNQRILLSPEQERELQRMQREVAETNSKLKQVRRKLQEEIDRLGVVLKAVNVLLMPLVVACAGIGFWLVRRWKTARAR